MIKPRFNPHSAGLRAQGPLYCPPAASGFAHLPSPGMCPSSTPEPVCHLPELWSWGLASSIPRSVEEQQYPPHPRGPPSFPSTPPPCFTLLQKQPSPKRPADSPEFISKSCYREPRRASQNERLPLPSLHHQPPDYDSGKSSPLESLEAPPQAPQTSPSMGTKASRRLAPSLPVLLVRVRLLEGFR